MSMYADVIWLGLIITIIIAGAVALAVWVFDAIVTAREKRWEGK